MNELEQRVAREICRSKGIDPDMCVAGSGGTPDAISVCHQYAWELELPTARAALKAHAEWLEEQKAAKKAGAKRKGGYARAAKLSPEERAQVARNAANVRWGNPQQEAYEDEPND